MLFFFVLIYLLDPFHFHKMTLLGYQRPPRNENVLQYFTADLQHNDTNSTHLVLIRKILLVDPASNGGTTVVVQVEVELAITSTELELLEEERVILQGKSIEDIKFGLKQERLED